MPLSISVEHRLRAVLHMAGFIGTGAPLFEIRDAGGPATDLLIRSPELGRALARSLASSNIVVMRGHGSTVTAPSLPLVVYRAIYAELNARYQSEAMRLGPINALTAEEAAACVVSIEGQVHRPWDLWTREAAERRAWLSAVGLTVYPGRRPLALRRYPGDGNNRGSVDGSTRCLGTCEVPNRHRITRRERSLQAFVEKLVQVTRLPICLGSGKARQHCKHCLRLRDLVGVIAVELACRRVVLQPCKPLRRRARHVFHHQLSDGRPGTSIALRSTARSLCPGEHRPLAHPWLRGVLRLGHGTTPCTDAMSTY